MYPVLLSTPWFNIYSYGFMVAVGYTVAMVLAIYQAKRNGLDTGAIFDLMLFQLVVGIIGSRLLFVLEYIPEKLLTKDFLAFEQGGMTFYGSVIIGFIFDLIYLKSKQIPFWKVMDCIGFSMGPGIAIARTGCFLNGCCYGKACSEAIGFQFRIAGPGYFHATQLYESFLCIIAFIIVLKLKKLQTHHGQIFLGFISIYGFFRFFIEFLRAENPVFLLGMTLSQFLGILFITAAVFTWKKIIKNQALQIMPETKTKDLTSLK